MKDDDKRHNHLDNLCDFLSDHPDEVILVGRIIDVIVSSTNVKVQKLMTNLFEKHVGPQQGSFLRFKGKLKRNPYLLTVENTKIMTESEQGLILRKSRDISTIDYIITKFPIDLRNGSTCSRNFFRSLDECSSDVIMSDFQYLINFKWNKLRPFIMAHAFGFWMLVTFMSMHIVFYNDSVILLVLCILFNFMFVVYELICASGELYAHLFRDMNWLDLFCLGVNCTALAAIWLNF